MTKLFDLVGVLSEEFFNCSSNLLFSHHYANSTGCFPLSLLNLVFFAVCFDSIVEPFDRFIKLVDTTPLILNYHFDKMSEIWLLNRFYFCGDCV